MNQRSEQLPNTRSTTYAKATPRQRDLLGRLRSANAVLHDLSWALEDLERYLQSLIDQNEGPRDILLEREIREIQRQRDDLEHKVIEQMLQTDALAAQLDQEQQHTP